MILEIDCLKDCGALCCRSRRNLMLVFDFSEEEAEMFLRKGAKLIPVEGGGYIMPKDCIFLRENRCLLHGLPIQPKCCVDNKAGEEICIEVRQTAMNSRYLEVE